MSITSVLIAAGFAFLASAAAGAGQSAVGQASVGLGLSGTVPALPPSAQTGKPATAPPAAVAPPEPGCVPALPCGTRLLGTIRKDGAVELQVPALRW